MLSSNLLPRCDGAVVPMVFKEAPSWFIKPPQWDAGWSHHPQWPLGGWVIYVSMLVIYLVVTGRWWPPYSSGYWWMVYRLGEKLGFLCNNHHCLNSATPARFCVPTWSFYLFSIFFIAHHCQKHQNIMFFIAYIQLITNLRPSSKQNRGKIHSLKNVVCYRKDKAAGRQLLPSPCVTLK